MSCTISMESRAVRYEKSIRHLITEVVREPKVKKIIYIYVIIVYHWFCEKYALMSLFLHSVE